MRLRSLLKPLAILAGCLLYAVPRWLTDEFGSVTPDQVLYHMRFGTQGLMGTDPELISRFVWRAVALPIALAMLLWGVDEWIKHLCAHPDKWPVPWLSRVYRGIRVRARRLGAWLLRLMRHGVSRAIPLVVLGAGTAFFVDSFSLGRYARSYFGEDYFSGSYVDPSRVAIKSGKTPPKNLVLIYVESLENTYSDATLFGHDLLQRLNAHKSRPGAISFNSYRELMGAHFTIAGIVSTQCGLPLKSVALFGGNKQGEQIERFLPRARCLGDILASHGYTNVFLNGSSLEFAGVGKFFHDHRYTRVMGREEWITEGERPERMSGWGLRDDDLFRRARGELDRLMKSRKPFNLTVLTIDTHHPYGHLSSTCKKQGYADFDGIVECTAGQVADFLDYIAAKGWSDRIAVVVQGDHLSMGNTSYDKLIKNPERRVFNLLLGARKDQVKNTDEVTHFDMLPTMLELMGFEVEGERAGLGYSAIGPATVARPPDRIAKMTEQLMNYSATYRALWELPPAQGEGGVDAAGAPPAPPEATPLNPVE